MAEFAGFSGFATPASRIVTVPDAGLAAANFVWVALGTVSGSLRSLEGAVVGRFDYVTLTSTDPAGVISTYVYLDPANLPRTIMLQFRTLNPDSWEHRAYWGENLIPWGTDGTVSRKRMGDLPVAGEWVRLEVAAADVGIAGHELHGMAFTVYDGQAWWDASAHNVSGVETRMWVDDAVPAGAVHAGEEDGWTWDTTRFVSGTQSHKAPLRAGIHQHYFYYASDRLTVAPRTYRVQVNGSGNFSQQVLPGTYTLTAPVVPGYATPAPQTVTVAGGATSSFDLVYVFNDFDAPVVTLTVPTEGQLVRGTITLTATASDPGSGIARVEFYRDGVLLGSDTTSAYTWNWSTTTVPDGTVRIEARAFDRAGLSASAFANVTVVNVSITGLVIDDLGAPIANARVALDPRAWFVGATATTDASGRYRFVLNEGSVTAHTIETYAVSGYTKRAAVDSRGGAFHTGTSQNYSTWSVPDLVLDRNGFIEGDVTDDSVVPVAIAGAGVFTEYVGYWVNCDPNYAYYCTEPYYRQYYNGGTVVYEAATDAAGRYRVAAPALPDVVVKPRKSAGYTTPGDAIAIGVPVGGLAASDVDFVYPRQATVTGLLTTNAGALPAVRIYYDGYDDFYSASTHSSDHRYTGFVDVAAGAASYSIGAPSGFAGSFRVYVQDYVAGFGYGFPNQHDVPAAERGAGATAAGKDFAWKAFATVTGRVTGLPVGTSVQLHLDLCDLADHHERAIGGYRARLV